MAYVTVHTLDGDPQQLLLRKQQHFDPVVRRVAPEFGAIASVTTVTQAGLLVVNVWESPEKVLAFTAHPEIQAAQAAAQLPMPSSFHRYESGSIDLFKD